MNTGMTTIFAAASLFIALTTPAWAGLDEGLAAYERGDYETALRELRALAEQGQAVAQSLLGSMYATARGVPRDDTKAARWYRKAADQGNANAQNNLGAMYFAGRGVPRDNAEAVRWFRKAAKQGVAEAQRKLGLIYYNGLGVPQDYGEALKWYRKAADQGNASAQNNLGIMYYRGRGVLQDYVQAHKWYSLAAMGLPPGKLRDMAARNRGIVAKRMTPAQIATAERLARAWQSTQGHILVRSKSGR